MIFKIDGLFFQLHSSLLVSSGTLSPHAARYHFHLPYLFSRQMWHEFEWRFRHIVFFILVFVEVPQGIRNTE
ncbi:hypothetical protein EV1_034366 [Malus domestica]